VVVATLAPVTPGQAAVLAGLVSAPSALVLAAGGLISDKGTGIIADNGGGLVANNGGNIIANNGSGYRLRALDQVPLVGVVVGLVDASGQAVLGPDGQAVTAVTDATGRYAFAGVRPDRHLVVRAELPKVGALGRIVAPDVADAPVDLASTIASTYILDKYVATQADRQATLARLPSAVEAETVLIAGTAAAGDAPLVTLASAEILKRVDALRATNTALDAQLEKVKKLLILAGASNLGAGEIATDVTLRRFQTIWPMPDGRVYLQVAEDGMLWRYDPDGRLRAVAGRAAEGPGAAVTVGEAPLVVDEKGRLLFGGAGGEGVWRLTPGAAPADLKVEDLTGGLVDVVAVCPLEGDAVFAMTWTPREAANAWRLEPGKAPKKLFTQEGQPPALASIQRMARLPDGTIRAQINPFLVPYVARFEPTTGATTKLKGWESGMLNIAMGIDGQVYYSNSGEEAVHLWDGAANPVVPDLRSADIGIANTFAVGADGAYFQGGGFAYSTKNATLNLRRGGTETRLAGLTAEASAAGPGVVSLTAPTAFTVEANGDLLVVDNGVLVRVKPGGTPVPVFASGLAAEGVKFKSWSPHALPGGAFFVVAHEDNDSFLTRKDAVFRVAADGTPTLVFRAFGTIGDVVQGEDGTLLVAATDSLGLSDFKGQVVRITPDGSVADVLPHATGNANAKVWLEGRRFVYATAKYGDEKTTYLPTRLEADGTLTPLPEAEGAAPFSDAQGRTYALGATISRTDPTTGETVVLAGPGGRVFTGSGVDDAVGTPKAPRFGPEGDLYFLDAANRQIKRIPADKL
jgi:hypothetical protein